MRFLSIDNIIPGTRLAKPLYGVQGIVLLRENAELTDVILNRLKEIGYTGLYIEDEISEGIQIPDIIDEKLRLEAAYRLESIVNGNGNIAEMMPVISEIVDNIISKDNIVLNMNQLRGHHEYTYLHCVNVGILSVSIGIKLGLTRERLLNLGTAGILHDIGKKYIPLEILDKPWKLDYEEFETIKKHPTFGYEMLTDLHEIAKEAKLGVLQHHERYDGSGYPKGLKAHEISLFGRILAVADTYDAMTSDRAYRNAFLPSEAVEYLMGSGNSLYDSEIIDKFSKCITVYPIGTCVELSNGIKAIVLENYSDCILRPLVRDLQTREQIDLKNNNEYYNICIAKIIM
ncbi:MAG: metal dependent phosphohydrolase [Anaerocolumna sp.]|nr:metal dependent phosphohydrolase [Anaerocolumna sp.]